jgi:hypothetical protein
MRKFFGLLFSLIILNSCAKEEDISTSAQSTITDYTRSHENSSEYENSIFAESTRNILDETYRKLITTASLRLRIDSLDKGTVQITDLLGKYNSYSSETRIYGNQRNYTIKVPAGNYKSFLEELTNIGKVIYFSERTEDVTIKYYDLESRLNTKKELMRTYQNYLGKAQKIEDILAVEAKISGLQNDIDTTGAEFNVLSNLIDYSTVELELSGPITANNYGNESLANRVKQLFTGLGEYVSTVLIILLGIVVYGIPAIIILILIYWILFGKIGLLKKVWWLVSEKKGKAG